MGKYAVTINTDSYVCQKCSKKAWEPGTMNDFMITLNGWHTTEYSLKEVLWRILLFQGNDFPHSEWNKKNENGFHLSDAYTKWIKRKCNWVTYMDRLCGCERMNRPSGYGFMQGYFNVQEVLDELKQNGIVKITFTSLYDLRQYYKGMNGCYMEIRRIG